MSFLEKLKGGFSKKADNHQVANIDVYKQKLKDLVYEDELVDELAPIFAKLHGNEGFDKVFELLQDKERQIEAIAGGEWYSEGKPETENVIDNEDHTPPEVTAESILAAKYSQQQ
ncbi:TPA: hypothetical protein ACX6QM_002584 [Photobacterium damselae]